MRQRLIVGNWKMNLTAGPATALARAVVAHVAGSPSEAVQVILCPPFTALSAVGNVVAGSHVTLGAQDCHHAVAGAYTGDVSAPMLADAGCRYVIIGHSERRRDHDESDRLIAAKATAALASGLVPILCIGESLTDHQQGRGSDVIRRQLKAFLDVFDSDSIRGCVIAYEPIWAIGSGLAATPEYAQMIHSVVREDLHARQAGDVPVLYGGSVTAGNAGELFACDDIDGALVGGASLVAESFCAIIDARAGALR